MAEGPGNHSRRAFRDLEIRQLRLRDPTNAARIIGRAKFAASRAAQVIHQHVMILGPARRIAHDPFKNFHQTNDLNLEPRLFADLAPRRILKALASFHDATRQRPPAFERFMAALDKQDPIAFDNESPHSQDG